MKSIITIACILVSICCITGYILLSKNYSTFQDEVTNAIESTILWQADLNPVNWEPIKLTQLLKNPFRFKKSGNFYKVKKDTTAFGHKVIYVGMIGYDLLAGPNIIVGGTPDSVASYIEKNNELELTHINGEYSCQLEEYVDLLIAKSPNNEGQTIIIGSYTGP
ncbi:MAG: hypothetical protein PF692_02070 [Kiritimatiellae bacterium]|nr:hypothetical protein [Kiritimatiellia bacterium]